MGAPEEAGVRHGVGVMGIRECWLSGCCSLVVVIDCRSAENALEGYVNAVVFDLLIGL